ncbi:MAG: Gfo/Idh/MocA family protein [Pirellulales bacterium]
MSEQSKRELSRRLFLEKSMLATTAALAAAPWTRARAADSTPESTSPNERLGVACIGVGGRGGDHLKAFSQRSDCEVLYVCDADEKIGRNRASRVKNQSGREPQYVEDMRKVFEDPAVDIVTTATPNHWHALCAIWAMQAGKDVYVEKPVSHNVSEGRRIVETARKHQRICQTGTQSRSNRGMQEAIDYIHSGKLGDVKLARGLCYKRRGSIGPRGDYKPPESVNYDLWSGPAELKPLTRRNLHYDWHWVWDYGNGDLGNQGIHQMDIARWGLGVGQLCNRVFSYGGRLGYEDAGDTANTQVGIMDFGDKRLVFEVRGLQTEPLMGAGVGNIFYGSDGYLVMTSYSHGAAFDPGGKQIREFGGGGDHYANFVDAVRSRKHEDLSADILEGHLSSALCHLSNVSYRLGEQLAAADVKAQLGGNADDLDTYERTKAHLESNGVNLDEVKLQCGADLAFNPESEQFKDNSRADALLTREYRAPFVVPAAGQV